MRPTGVIVADGSSLPVPGGVGPRRQLHGSDHPPDPYGDALDDRSVRRATGGEPVPPGRPPAPVRTGSCAADPPRRLHPLRLPSRRPVAPAWGAPAVPAPVAPAAHPRLGHARRAGPCRPRMGRFHFCRTGPGGPRMGRSHAPGPRGSCMGRPAGRRCPRVGHPGPGARAPAQAGRLERHADHHSLGRDHDRGRVRRERRQRRGPAPSDPTVVVPAPITPVDPNPPTQDPSLPTQDPKPADTAAGAHRCAGRSRARGRGHRAPGWGWRRDLHARRLDRHRLRQRRDRAPEGWCR